MLSDVKLQLKEISSRQRALSHELKPQTESKLLDFYVRLIPRILDAQRCSVFIHDRASGKVWLKSGTGVAERGIEVSVSGSVVGDVIASGRPTIATDMVTRNGAHKEVDTTTGFTTRELIAVPIHSQNRTNITGAIEVLNKNSGGNFNAEDQAFLEEVAEHFQSVVESIYLGQEAVGMTRTAVAAAGRAIYVGFLAAATGIFVAVFVSVYGGFPLLFR